MIPVGTIPPNPTELLFSERFATLLEQLRMEYDYIFIDCPPVEIVADASIINKYSDLTLFIIRAGLLDRNLLADVEKFHTEMCIRDSVRFALRKRNLFVRMLLLEYKRGLYSVYNVRPLVLCLRGI